MKYTSAKIYITLYLAFVSSLSFAESVHQFSLNLGRSNVEYDNLGEARSYDFSATGYIEPVKKSNSLPLKESAFYNRVGSISTTATRKHWENMSIIFGGNVIKRANTTQYSISTFIAEKNTPVWASLNFQHLDKMTYHFSSGSRYNFKSDSVHGFSLGAFIGNSLSIYGLYSKQDDKTYGAGLLSLFDLSNFGFLETKIELSKTNRKRRDRLDPLLTNNYDLDFIEFRMNEKAALIQLSYFPIPETSLSLSYQQIGYDIDNMKNHFYYANINQYITDSLKIGIHYSHKNDYEWFSLGDYDLIGLSLGFEL